MKFAFYISLNDRAKEAVDRGNGKHVDLGFRVDGDYIAAIETNGKVEDWIKIIRTSGPVITEQTN